MSHSATAWRLFSASNNKLVESLSGVENTLSQAMARSDEQLAYYVAQARKSST